MRAVLFAAVLLVVTPVMAVAQTDGAALAERWCSACHADGTGRATDAAPTIRDIAARHAGAPGALRAFLVATHGPMPDLALSRDQADALVAWLLAQAPR
jgi:mono/diheme cytochrome c family protein